MASYRLRVQIPADHLQTHGYRTFINGGEGDFIVFSKPSADDIENIRRVKASGAKAVVDICDDHFQTPKWGEIYTLCAKAADRVVCSTEELAKRIYLKTGVCAQVVPDPWEFEEKPHARGDKFLWFGHQLNIAEIARFEPVTKNLNIRYCTGPNQILAKYTEWSVQALRGELAIADVVILPTTEENTYKSANRLICAVMAGCFVVAGKSEINRKFRDYVWVGPVHAGVAFAKCYQNDLLDLTTRAQDHIRAKYSPAEIGAQWASVFDSI
jgi:hypothetical protein